MSRIIVPVIIILLALGLFFTYVDPTYKSVQQTLQQIEKYDGVLRKVQELQTLRDSLVEAYNNIETEDLERLEKLLPKNVDNVRLIIEIESVALAHELTLERVTVTDIQDSDSQQRAGEESGVTSTIPQLKSVGLEISVIANYEQFLEFIGDLERSLRIVDMRAVTFAIDENSEISGETSYTIVLETYWLE